MATLVDKALNFFKSVRYCQILYDLAGVLLAAGLIGEDQRPEAYGKESYVSVEWTGQV
jgi:hypothetical protein